MRYRYQYLDSWTTGQMDICMDGWCGVGGMRNFRHIRLFLYGTSNLPSFLFHLPHFDKEGIYLIGLDRGTSIGHMDNWTDGHGHTRGIVWGWGWGWIGKFRKIRLFLPHLPSWLCSTTYIEQYIGYIFIVMILPRHVKNIRTSRPWYIQNKFRLWYLGLTEILWLYIEKTVHCLRSQQNDETREWKCRLQLCEHFSSAVYFVEQNNVVE